MNTNKSSSLRLLGFVVEKGICESMDCVAGNSGRVKTGIIPSGAVAAFPLRV